MGKTISAVTGSGNAARKRGEDFITEERGPPRIGLQRA